jgi:hypothetical protein
VKNYDEDRRKRNSQLIVMPALVCVNNVETGVVSFLLKTTNFEGIMNKLSQKFEETIREKSEREDEE